MNQENEKKNSVKFFSSNKDRIIMGALIFLMIIIIGQLWYIGSLKKENLTAYAESPAPQKSPDRAADRYAYVREWDPFQEMNRMQRNINSLFNDSFFRSGYGLTASPRQPFFYEPDIDVQETEDKYIIKVDMPGIEKENISVTVKNGYLTVQGERNSETEERSEDDRFFRMERSFGSFQRSIPLPGEVDDTALTADYKKGVLTVILPKIVPQQEDSQEGRSVTVN